MADNIQFKRERWKDGKYRNVARAKRPAFRGVTSRTRYTNVEKIVVKRAISSKVGQLYIKLLAKKGKDQKVTVDGFSFLNDPTRRGALKKMERQAFKSAYSKIPFSPDHVRIVQRRFIYFEPNVKSGKLLNWQLWTRKNNLTSFRRSYTGA